MDTYTLRDKALSLPANHPARVKYRDFVRACANASDDLGHGYNREDSREDKARAAVESAVNAAVIETGVTLYRFTESGARAK
jgi:hypothetical protein